MNREQWAHLLRLSFDFDRSLSTKYVAGAREHGGNIWDQSITQLLDNAIAEVVDQWVYLMTIRLKLELLFAKDPAILTFTSSTEFETVIRERLREGLSATGRDPSSTPPTPEE